MQFLGITLTTLFVKCGVVEGSVIVEIDRILTSQLLQIYAGRINRLSPRILPGIKSPYLRPNGNMVFTTLRLK